MRLAKAAFSVQYDFKGMLREKKTQPGIYESVRGKVELSPPSRRTALDEFICMHGTLQQSNFMTFNDSDHLIICERLCWSLPSLSLTR